MGEKIATKKHNKGANSPSLGPPCNPRVHLWFGLNT